jgi:hypothetical protein
MNSFLVRFLIFILGVLAVIYVLRLFTPMETMNTEHSGVLPDKISDEREPIQRNQPVTEQPSSAPMDSITRSPATDPSDSTSKLYQWVDDVGKTQYSKIPPEGRDYREINYQPASQSSQGTATKKPSIPLKTTPSKPVRDEIKSSDQTFTVPIQCQNKLRAVERYEQKLDKSKDLVESIWLADYCSALSELIQDGCVVPKQAIKYNRYCPVRYK